ncbi:MAG: LysM peptidoglycan-binding domain-containing protein [Phycisphaerae bacterium]
MNKETKIGLVTGVTLIVLIGAMLSSYLSGPRDKVGDLALTGQGSSLRNQISSPVGIAQVPVPQNVPVIPVQPVATAPVPPAKAQTSVAVSTPYNQVTQLPYGSAATATSSVASLTPAAAVIKPQVVPVVVAQRPVLNTAASGDNASDTARVSMYIVRPGDTLGKIAWHFYHDSGPVAVRRIVDANASKLGIAHAMIRVGETLTIPAAQQAATSSVHLLTMAAQSTGNSYSGQYSTRQAAPTSDSSVHTYRVQSGDTLWGIARKTMGAGTDANVHRIMSLNHIHDARTIAVGQVLKIPS